VPRPNGSRVARTLGPFVNVVASPTNGRIDFGSHAAYAVGAAGSIVTWVRVLEHDPGDHRIVAFTVVPGSANDQFEVVRGGSSLVVYRFNGGIFQGSPVNVPNAFPIGELACVVVAWTTSEMRVYVNGVMVALAAVAWPAFTGTPALTLGNMTRAPSQPARAAMGGELYLYARQLTRREVEAHYFDGEVPEGPVSAWGPTGWPGQGTTVALTKGAGNAGTIVSGVVLNERAAAAPRERAARATCAKFGLVGVGSSGGWIVADTAEHRPTNFTIECRLRFDSHASGGGSGYRGIITKTTSIAWGDGWGLVEVANAGAGIRNLRLFIGSYGAGTTFMLSPHGREAHVVATHDGTTARVYVDGALVGSWTQALTQVAVPMRIGHGYNGTGGYPFDGTIRDVRYYSRALNEAEVRDRAERDADIRAGLLGAWHLDETPRQGTSSPIAAAVAKDRIGGASATWDNSVLVVDAEDLTVAEPRLITACLPQNAAASSTAKTAVLSSGAGSFTIAFDYLVVDGRAQTNVALQCSDVGYATDGWLLNQWGTSLLPYLKAAGFLANLANVFVLGRWQRIVCVFDRAAERLTVYRDGLPVAGVAALAASWGTLAATPAMLVGAAAVGRSISRIRYHRSRAWTPAEVLADARGVDVDATSYWPISVFGSDSTRDVIGGADFASLTAQQAGPGFAYEPDADLLPSQDITDAIAWVSKGAAVTRAKVAGGDLFGGPAYSLVSTAVTSAFVVEQAVPGYSTNRRMRLEVDFKYDSCTWVTLTANTGGTTRYFNVQTGTAGSGNSLASSVTALGDGWYRCAMEYLESDATSGGSGGGTVRIYLASADGNVVVTGTGAERVTIGRQRVRQAQNRSAPACANPNVGVRTPLAGFAAPNYVAGSAIGVTTDLSMRVRVRIDNPTTTGGPLRMMSVGEYPNGALLTWEIGAATPRLGLYWLGQTVTLVSAVPGIALPTSKWCDVVATFNRTTRVASVFVDSVLVATGTFAGAMGDLVAQAPTLGRAVGGEAVASYARARWYGRALTQGDVEALYRGEEVSGCVISWDLNEGAGTTVADRCGGNTGTFGGSLMAWLTE